MGGLSSGVGQRQEQKMTKFQSFNEDDYTLYYQTHFFVPRGYINYILVKINVVILYWTCVT